MRKLNLTALQFCVRTIAPAVFFFLLHFIYFLLKKKKEAKIINHYNVIVSCKHLSVITKIIKINKKLLTALLCLWFSFMFKFTCGENVSGTGLNSLEKKWNAKRHHTLIHVISESQFSRFFVLLPFTVSIICYVT